MALIKPTSIDDLKIVISNAFEDNRGKFINIFRSQEDSYKEIWKSRKIQQVNYSLNYTVGTVRGLHYQDKPYTESKLIRCISGAIWDVAVDLRKDSKTYLKWFGIELSPKKLNALFIPEGFAHGFQVLKQKSEILYIHSGIWIKASEKGIRWNDPTISINWPLPISEISQKDLDLPYLNLDEL